MKLAIEAVCYKEERFLPKFIDHYKNKVDEIVILNSTKPWKGEPDVEEDKSGDIGRRLGVTVIEYTWDNEHSQRNAGLDYCSGFDWVCILDPDEFIADEEWEKLVEFLKTAEAPAYVVKHQRVFWKRAEVYPHTDYQQIIAVKPSVRFIEGRIVNSPYAEAPVELLHFSWARTDKEVLNKISHYTHADELIPNWYKDVWLADKRTNLHPKTPEALKALVPAILPSEIEALNLWS